MKKLGLAALGVLSLFILTGCGSNKTNMKIDADQPLTKVGQYHEADSENPKTTLLAIKDMQKTQKVKQVTFKFKNAKLLKMEAKDKSQLSIDEGNFGMSLPNIYYEYQIDYSLKNNSNSAIHDNGAEIILPNGKQLSSNEGAMDSLIGQKIQPHASKSGFIQAKANKNDKKKLTQFKFVSPELFDNSNQNVNISQTTISFK